MATKYRVTTRDVDGGSTRTYKRIAGALKRFEDMAGFSVKVAFEELNDGRPAPDERAIASVRGVSMYGTVVVFVREGEQEEIPAPPAPAAVELGDIEDRINALNEARAAARETRGDTVAQHRSESAAFGDSWPGAQLAIAQQAKAIDELDRQYENLLASPEGLLYQEMRQAEAEHDEAYENGRFVCTSVSDDGELPF